MGVVEPSILYGAEIWGSTMKNIKHRNALDTVYCPALLAMSGAYRTTPAKALQMLLGVCPLWVVTLGRWAVAKKFKKRRKARIQRV